MRCKKKLCQKCVKNVSHANCKASPCDQHWPLIQTQFKRSIIHSFLSICFAIHFARFANIFFFKFCTNILSSSSFLFPFPIKYQMAFVNLVCCKKLQICLVSQFRDMALPVLFVYHILTLSSRSKDVSESHRTE